MDRNNGVHYDNYNLHVALRKESVDRNKYVVQCRKTLGVVALRKESVDRNVLLANGDVPSSWSLSARRAWIEITDMSDAWHRFTSRSPQGERG